MTPCCVSIVPFVMSVTLKRKQCHKSITGATSDFLWIHFVHQMNMKKFYIFIVLLYWVKLWNQTHVIFFKAHILYFVTFVTKGRSCVCGQKLKCSLSLSLVFQNVLLDPWNKGFCAITGRGSALLFRSPPPSPAHQVLLRSSLHHERTGLS